MPPIATNLTAYRRGSYRLRACAAYGRGPYRLRACAAFGRGPCRLRACTAYGRGLGVTFLKDGTITKFSEGFLSAGAARFVELVDVYRLRA